MEKLQLSKDNFTQNTIKHLLASSYGNGSNKQLYAMINLSDAGLDRQNIYVPAVTFQVWSGDVIKCDIPNLDDAIELYNSLP